MPSPPRANSPLITSPKVSLKIKGRSSCRFVLLAQWNSAFIQAENPHSDMQHGSTENCVLCTSLRFHPRWHRALPWTPVRSKNLFSQPQRFRRDFNEFVVLDELNCLFQAEGLVRNQPDGVIGGRRTHTG